MTEPTTAILDESRGQQYRMDAALHQLLKESRQWEAAQLLARKYFALDGTKYVTEFRYKGRWIVTQWVTTYSKHFDTGPLALVARVGISRRRRKAFQHMAQSRWLPDVSEPAGLTISVRFLLHLGE